MNVLSARRKELVAVLLAEFHEALTRAQMTLLTRYVSGGDALEQLAQLLSERVRPYE